MSSSRRQQLAIAAWLLFCWTWRGIDGPFIAGTLLCISWFALTPAKLRPRLPSMARSLAWIWLLLLTGSLALRLWQGEIDAARTLERHLEWASLLLCLPFAQLLLSLRPYWPLLFAFPALAVVARVVSHTDIDSLTTTLFSSSLQGFGRYHVAFGLQAYLATLALLVFSPAIWRRWPKPVCAVLLLATGLLVAQSLVASGSRLALLALFSAVLVLLWRGRRTIWAMLCSRRGAISLGLAALLMATLAIQNWAQIEKRVVNVAFDTSVYSLDLSQLPRDKDVYFARRVHLSTFGLSHFTDRPLMGHGPGAVRELIRQDPDFTAHGHLHNTYVQTLVELGLLGSLPLAAFVLLLCMHVWRAQASLKPDSPERPVASFLIAGGLSLGLWSFGDVMVTHADWRFPVIWLGALALALSMTQTPEKA